MHLDTVSNQTPSSKTWLQSDCINFSKIQGDILISVTIIIIGLYTLISSWTTLFFFFLTSILVLIWTPVPCCFHMPLKTVMSTETPELYFICTWFECQSYGNITWQPKHLVCEREDRLTLKSFFNLTARITSPDRHHGASKVNTESPSGDGDPARCYAGSYLFVMVSEKDRNEGQYLYSAEEQILKIIQNILEKYLLVSIFMWSQCGMLN